MRLRSGVLIALAFLVIVIGTYVLITLRDLGEFKAITPEEPVDCQPVLGVQSSEDITIDEETGVAYISGADRRVYRGESLPGAIYSYPLLTRPLQPTALTSDLDFVFRPHGLSFYQSPGGSKLLFVVNHREDGDYIETFEVGEEKLVHRESITGNLLFSANDIVAVGERRFYVTRDHGYKASWSRQLEELLRLSSSSVLYFDGEQFKIAAEGIAYANGINISPDGERLYVAATLSQSLHVFERDPVTGVLSSLEEIALGTGVDNIEVSPDGDLWIGAHPRLLAFSEYSQDPTLLSPSQVIRLTFSENGEHQVESIYLSQGEYLSGSSVAARWRNYLLIGSVCDRRFLLCKMETAEQSEP